MRLVLHLLERGLVNHRAVMRAVTGHLASSPPLGQLALYRGVLQVEEVVQVLDAQLEQPHMRFGELAVAMGLCSLHDIETLLEEQQARAVSPQTLLVRQGALSAGRMALEADRLAHRAAEECTPKKGTTGP